jgi:xylulokinase
MSGGRNGRRLVLGIDLGSSSAKAVLADEAGEVVARAQVPQRISRPVPGAAEQAADTWMDAVRDLVAVTWGRLASGGARSEEAGLHLAALSVSGHYPTLLLADASGNPLAPAFLYGDTRADARVEEAARIGGERLAGDEWLPKILWLASERPELLARTRAVFDPHDHVAFRLTGRRGLDHRSARRSGGLFDPVALTWRTELARRSGLDPAALPPLRRSGEILGSVTPEAAAATGLPAGTEVVVGIGDTPAELIGAGVVRPGQVLLYYGTTTSADVCTHDFEAYLRDPAPIGDWAPYREVAYAVLGPAMPWVARGLVPPVDGADPPDLAALDSAAAAIEPSLEGPYVVPHFLAHARPGEPVRVPAIIGLDADDTRADLHRAVLESYAFSVRAGLESAGLETAGLDLAHLSFVATGGGARSAFWRQLVSDVLGAAQEWRPSVDAALGSAAVAAWGACGADVFSPDGWGRTVKASTTFPDTDRHRDETERYRRWLRVRDAIAGATR